MAYCRNCGKDIQNAEFCPYCGTSQSNRPVSRNVTRSQPGINNAYSGSEQYSQNPPPATPDTGSAGWAVLGFCLPIVGLILWIVWNSSHPQNAKKAGMGALVSVIISIVFYVIIALVGVGTAFSL